MRDGTQERRLGDASMGPRLVSRGKIYPPSTIFRFRDASMGPRLVSRGKLKASLDQAKQFIASMGPRLVSRGKLHDRTRRKQAQKSFNGAATC